MTTTAAPTLSRSSVIIEVGGLPIQLNVDNPLFLEMLGKRYAGFVGSAGPAKFEFEIDLVAPGVLLGSEEVQVTWKDGLWRMERGDFCAVWNPALARGRIRQTANPYSLDCVLRIVHTLLLAREGGFLVHASSAVRNGRAFLFSGVSGAGKTTMASLAPPDVALLTDEISYVTVDGSVFRVRHTVRGRTGASRRKYAGADCGAVPAGERPRKQNRIHWTRGGRARTTGKYFIFCKGPRTGGSCFSGGVRFRWPSAREAADFCAGCAGVGDDRMNGPNNMWRGARRSRRA